MTRYLRERTLFGPLIAEPPLADLGLTVVIPSRDEDESLIRSLESLSACDAPDTCVEVIVVVNTSEADSPDTFERNTRCAENALDWSAKNSTPRLRFHILESHGLPKKHAGVGLARKIGMDEACRRFESIENPRGVIACFDADSQCDPNYLIEIETLFRRKENCQACSIYFEHPTEGNEFPPEIYEAITHYELHLRYFINAQKFAGFPFATQTIGSSMAVRSDAYQSQNGMNRRQAGEDFYFLHKFTPLGNVAELTATRVIPSPRESHRVPFGTGKAVGDMLTAGDPCLSYAPQSFLDLKNFLGRIDELWEEPQGFEDTLPESVRSFLDTQSFSDRVTEVRKNVTTTTAFRTRFFRWFNAFVIMKYLHYARDHFHPDVEVVPAAQWLLKQSSDTVPETARDLLTRWRFLDRQ
jgi:glycosyltransferase involved in cell wall biosynthesis